MEYMTVQDAAQKWDITGRRIQALCAKGRIEGAKKFGRQWAIPTTSPKPTDARVRTGKYKKDRSPQTDGTTAPKKAVIFSFFSGSGFLDLGFERNGFEIGLVNELQPAFMQAYRYARKKMGLREPKYGYFNIDINEFLGPQREALRSYIADARADDALIGFIGGPPCPDFSVAGKNRGREGDNGKLSLSYIRLIIAMKPDFFLFENVKGLWQTARHRAFYEELKRKLHGAGYVTRERLTNALEFGAPQDRDRILLFGMRSNKLNGRDMDRFDWERYSTQSLEQVKGMAWPDTAPFHADVRTECPEGLPRELTVEYWFEKNDVLHHPNAKDHFLPRNGLARMESIDEGDVSRKSFKRLHRWRYSPTVAYGNNEVHLHPYKARRISAAEALSLQTLPKEFELPPDMTLTDKFKTIGNGVPYLLAEGVAKTIRDFLDIRP